MFADIHTNAAATCYVGAFCTESRMLWLAQPENLTMIKSPHDYCVQGSNG